MPQYMHSNPEITSVKPLYKPEPLPVKEDPSGSPVRVGKGRLLVTAVDDRWRIDDEWWRQDPVSRMYYALILENGERLVVYKDLIAEKWYQQRF